MVTNMGYFYDVGLLCSIDQTNPKSRGYFDRPFMQIYKQEPFLSKKQIWRSYRKKYECST